jgi:predicted ATP-grasp superfamily ATP-dependent carboligase
MDALLTDANERAALAAARSLVNAGYSVAAGSPRRLSLAAVSRGVHRLRLSPSLLADPPRYAREVGKAARELNARVLLPVTDASVEAILSHRADIPSSAVLPFPDIAVYRAASDKAAMLPRARRAGLAVPETIVLEHQSSTLPRADFFPAVVKPHRSIVGSAATRRHLPVRFVASPAQCRAVLADLPAAAFPILLQRRVQGAGEGLFMLRWNGRVIAEFAHRRLREKPPEGGVSVYRESIAPDAELVAAGRQLLADLDWQGVAMIECKREAGTGRPVFMEVNGRLWGSLQLAIDAGVDFPRLLMACALGERVQPVTQYRIGVRSRWFWGDVDQLYLRLRNGESIGGKLGALRDFLRIDPRRNREEIWRWRDPAPFVLESLQQFGLIR